LAAGGVSEPADGSIEFSDFVAGTGKGYDQRGCATIRAGDGEGRVDRLAAADEIDGTSDLRRDLFDDEDTVRRQSMREGDLSVPRERERIPATGLACGWFVRIGFVRSAFGKSGFYRLVESGPEHWRVRNFTTLHELFRVYVDPEGVLRTDHKISFVGLTILRLHYKMTPLGKQSGAPSGAAEKFPAGQAV
jgi:hypothetical protein